MSGWVRFSHMSTSVTASCLVISGGRTSSGSSSRMLETASRTSLAALSMSRSRENSTVIWESPSLLMESTFLMPSTPLMRSSMSCVTRRSTTAAAAPGYVVSMEMMGGSMSGYSRTCMRV